MTPQGRLVVISGPSGVGKTTVCDRLLAAGESDRLRRVVTCTTRPPREGERDGLDYHFLPREEFREGIEKGRFLEYAEVHGHFYGTPRRDVEDGIAKGLDMLLNIDVQGAESLRRAEVEPMSSIFLVPPSRGELERRLKSRSTDSDDEIARRLQVAEQEMEQRLHYDHVVVNEDVDRAVGEIREILSAGGCPGQNGA